MSHSAGGMEVIAWEYLKKGDRKKAIQAMREGAKKSFGRGRAGRMRDYADAIEETELKTKDEIEKWLNNKLDPEDMGGDM